MPTVITNYAVNVDLHRFMVTSAPTGLLGVPNFLSMGYTSAPTTYAVEEFTLEKVASTDSAYHLRYNVYAHGQLLGYLLTDRTKKYGYNQQLCPLHVTNEAFYTVDFAYLIPKFLKMFGMEIHNTSQIDICLFTQQKDPAKLIESYTKNPGSYQRITRKNDSGVVTVATKDEETGKPLYTTTYFGFGSQSVTLKIYNKTAELTRKPKSYLTAWHEANGFDPSKPVYSMEVSIKAKALKEYRPAANNNVSSKASRQTEITSYNIEIENLNQPAYLLALFRHFLPVDVRKKDATRATNCTRVELIDYTIYPETEVNTTVQIKPTSNRLTMEKKTLQTLVREYTQTGEDYFLAAAHNMAQRHQLTETLAQLLAKLQPQREAA